MATSDYLKGHNQFHVSVKDNLDLAVVEQI